jgi:ABC-type multidrug transport system permease subunit
LKDRVNTALLFLQSPLIALLLISLFGGDGYSKYQENPLTLLFILIISSVWFGVINSVREIVSERAIFNREHLFGVRILPYILSKFTILSLLSLIQVSLLVGIVHLFVPLEINILHLISIIFLMSLSGLGIGMLLSSITKSPAQALALVPVILLPMIIFAGGMIPIKDMPTNRSYIDAYRVSMLMPTRWSLEEVLREYDNYGEDSSKGLREPIQMNCEEFNQTQYPNYICEYDYNALYRDDVDLTVEGCEGRRCIESNYIDLINGVWRNTPSWLIWVILTLYAIFPILLTSIILKRRSKKWN